MHMMNLPANAVLPDLQVSNDILDDRAALDAEWQKRGYWFFRDIIPHDALARFRQPVIDALKTIGLVDADSQEPVWNHESMDRFPKAAFGGYEALPGLVHSRRWMDFVADPGVVAVFKRVLGAEANWVAVAETRATPPGEDLTDGLFTYPHQDGFYNEGYRCLTAWIPLWNVSKAAGGLAVAEGYHHGELYHDRTQPPPCPIPPGAIPDDAWRTADYRPGDVILFDRMLPHSGQRNRSADYFRTSLDIRCVLPGDPVPVFGTVEASTPAGLEVLGVDGKRWNFSLDQDSYVRAPARSKSQVVALPDIPENYPRGQEVLVTHDEGRVVMLREPKY